MWLEFDPPIEWTRARPDDPRWALTLRLRGIKQRGGPWYLIDHLLADRRSGTTRLLEDTSRADWDRNGDLLFARGGGLYRLPLAAKLAPEGGLGERLLADFSGLVERRLVSPPAARRW